MIVRHCREILGREVLGRVGGWCVGTIRRVCFGFLEVDFVELLREPGLLLGMVGQSEGLMGSFKGLRGTSGLLLRASGMLFGDRLLLSTRCRLLDLVHCRGVVRWPLVWRLRASRLLLGAFRMLFGDRLLLSTRCRLLDLLHCRGVLRWWWFRRWASPVLVQVLGRESSLDRGQPLA